MSTVKVKVNGIEVECPSNATVLEAAHLAGVEIPTLCYMKDISAIGACRMCVTEVKGMKGLVAACVYPVADGIEIITNSQRVNNARKMTLELILSNHRRDCLTCDRNQNCELQKLAKDYNIKEMRFGHPDEMKPQIEDSMIHLIRDNSKCILCRRCVAADLTILEEGTEFIERLESGKNLPLITSCSPGWVKFCEHYFPEFIPNLSSCKSPQQMFGAMMKTYYAGKTGTDPKDMFVVSIMPCTAKKTEIVRREMQNGGYPNVDAVLTTRELAEMIREAGIDFVNLPDSDFDAPLGLSTGAADIFGVTGGVMEAALRTVYELVTGRELPFDNLHVTPIVGLEGVKEAAIKIENTLPEYKFLDGVELRVAVTSGLRNARRLVEQIAEGTSPYHFIEVMGCPGGCITGGGQPRSSDPEVRMKRLRGIYEEDEFKAIRKSHENPAIVEIYREFLGSPNGDLSHELLHTHYTPRGKYNELTDETFVREPEAPEKKAYIPVSPLAVQITRREVAASARKDPDVDPTHVLALELENQKLKHEIEESQETIRLLKDVIASYSSKR